MTVETLRLELTAPPGANIDEEWRTFIERVGRRVPLYVDGHEHIVIVTEATLAGTEGYDGDALPQITLLAEKSSLEPMFNRSPAEALEGSTLFGWRIDSATLDTARD